MCHYKREQKKPKKQKKQKNKKKKKKEALNRTKNESPQVFL